MAVSAALALQEESPTAKVTLLEGLEKTTASKAPSKCVRTPYVDEGYVLLAQRAEELWKTKLPYSKFYRQTGWIQVVRGDDYVPFHSRERLISVNDVVHMVNTHEPPKIDAEERLWLNREIGVADAALALEAVAIEAKARGVVRQDKDASKLLVDDGVCYGVECTDGTRITAVSTIVATGPWTLALLQRSNIPLPHKYQNGFFNVTAIGVATLQLSDEDYSRFHSMPILTTNQGTFESLVSTKPLTWDRRSDASNSSPQIYGDN